MYSTRADVCDQLSFTEQQVKLVASLNAFGLRPLASVCSDRGDHTDVALIDDGRRSILLRFVDKAPSASLELTTILCQGPFEAAFFVDGDGIPFDHKCAPVCGDAARAIALRGVA